MSKYNNISIPIYLQGVNYGIPLTPTQSTKLITSSTSQRSVYDGTYFAPSNVPTFNTYIQGSYRPGQTYHAANYCPTTNTVWYHGK